MEVCCCLKSKQSKIYSLPKQSPRISVSFVNLCDVFITTLCSKTHVNELSLTKFCVLKLLELIVKVFVTESGFRDLIP